MHENQHQKPVPGTVKRVQKGAVNGEVEVELAFGQRLVAIVTNDSLKSLGLKAGVPVVR